MRILKKTGLIYEEDSGDMFPGNDSIAVFNNFVPFLPAPHLLNNVRSKIDILRSDKKTDMVTLNRFDHFLFKNKPRLQDAIAKLENI